MDVENELAARIRAALGTNRLSYPFLRGINHRPREWPSPTTHHWLSGWVWRSHTTRS